VLAQEILADAEARHGRAMVRQAVRDVLGAARARLLVDPTLKLAAADVARQSRDRLEQTAAGLLRPVINATGILLHTGLGRAPLAAEAVEAVARVSAGYSNLEYDLESGSRGRRTSGVNGLLREITGAEAAFVVNNNAAATVLSLRALAAGKEVIVSRGELVEIGGSFRLPEIMEVSGAKLREVGTTNKTRLSDYQAALGAQTAAILRVHPSNFRVVGFTERVEIAHLVALGRAHGVLVIDDIGSGALASGVPAGVTDEPTVAAGLAAGADLVLFSGDKLLGGPQCGIMLGRHEVIRRVESDPLARAFRVDKMTIAALEATLRLAADAELGAKRIPVWRMIHTPVAELKARAEALAAALRTRGGWNAEAVGSEAFIGGGSAPYQAVASAAVAISGPFPGAGPTVAGLASKLRQGAPPVVARVHKGQLWLDLRTVSESMEPELLRALDAIAAAVTGDFVRNGQSGG
jgi:L-seryl-tRNA(Ser) seleniumtransferase